MSKFILKHRVEFITAFPPVLLFLIPLICGKVIFWGTPSFQFIPWQSYIVQNIVAGNSVLWNPLNGMGAPLVANYQVGFYYPLNWLLYILGFLGGGGWIAWGYSLLSVFHLVWAGWGMAMLMRRLEVGEFGQVIAGISFELCGFLVGRLEFFSIIWAVSWLPWIIRAVSKIAAPVHSITTEDKDKLPPWILLELILCLTMQLLAGHAQITWYTWILTGVWLVVGLSIRGNWRVVCLGVLRFVFAVSIAIIISSVQLLPTAEYLAQSQRSDAVAYDNAMTYSFWPWRIATIAAPDLFGNPGVGTYWGYASYWEDALYFGFLPLALALSTLSQLFKRHENDQGTAKYSTLIRLSWSLILLVLILAMGKFTPIFPFLYNNAPTFNMFNSPTRWMIIAQFLLIVLASVAGDNWRTPSKKIRNRWKLIFTAALALTLGAIVAWFALKSIETTLVQSTVIAGGSALAASLCVILMPRENNARKMNIWRSVVVGWIALDLLVFSSFLVPITNQSLFTETNDPTWGNLTQENGERLFISKHDEYLIKYSRILRFKDFRPIEQVDVIKKILLPNMNLLHGVPSVNNFDPLVPERYARWMANLENLPDDELINWLKLMNVGVWEQRIITLPQGVRFVKLEAWGRYQWYDNFTSVQNADEAWEILCNEVKAIKSGEKLKKAIIEVPAGNEFKTNSQNEKTIQPITREIVNKPGYLELNVNFSGSGILVIADTWYPGWQVLVDGQERELLRANYLFMGVILDKGDHQVIFRYSPNSSVLGGILTIGGCVFLISSYIIQRTKKEKYSRKEK